MLPTIIIGALALAILWPFIKLGYELIKLAGSLVLLVASCAIGAVALIGRDAPLIEEALSATGIPMARQTTLEEAVYWLWARHAQGDVLLLSPACASWDMFRDYAERSARFIACARAIAAEEQAC